MKARIIKYSEKTFDKDGRPLRPGDIVEHVRFGTGQVHAIDNTSFSIDMVIVNLIKDGKYSDKIIRSAVEFTKKG